jgi:hypothetical protein
MIEKTKRQMEEKPKEKTRPSRICGTPTGRVYVLIKQGAG